MKQTLSYVLVTPYTIVKSRTGGVISRLLSRLSLELVGAQMLCPDENIAREYAATIRNLAPQYLSSDAPLLSDYIENNIGPSGGRRHRSLLLVFRGEDPCKKLSEICGSLLQEVKNMEYLNVEAVHGETIRDTYADLVCSREDPNKIIYFEPAILTPRDQDLADENLAIFSKCIKQSENIVTNITYPDPSKIERTLVMIKPDNWKYTSLKPGVIIDMFSRTGLRIVGIKVHRFSLREALEFYGPVETALKDKLGPVYGKKAREILERELALPLEHMEKILTGSIGVECAKEEFRKLVEFMSGSRPEFCQPEDMDKPGQAKCMILVYEGEDAITKIRDVLGPTDPVKAPGGTVRREFGFNVMVNTAHASDSRDSYEREKEIVKISDNYLGRIIDDYLSEKAHNIT